MIQINTHDLTRGKNPAGYELLAALSGRRGEWHMSEVAETQGSSYNYRTVRQFAVMTVVWGVVGMAVGVSIAAQLIWPKLNFGRVGSIIGKSCPRRKK